MAELCPSGMFFDDGISSGMGDDSRNSSKSATRTVAVSANTASFKSGDAAPPRVGIRSGRATAPQPTAPAAIDTLDRYPTSVIFSGVISS